MGVIPKAFIVHILLLIVDCIWLLNDNAKNRLLSTELSSLFLIYLKDEEIDPWEPDRTTVFYNVEDLRYRVEQSLNFTYSLPLYKATSEYGNAVLMESICDLDKTGEFNI